MKTAAIKPRLLHTTSRIMAKRKLNLQTICCHYIRTLDKAAAPLVSPCKRREAAPSHASSAVAAVQMTAGHLAGERASSRHGDATHADPGTPACPLDRCLPRRNPGDYNTSSSHWLLARQAKQLGCYGNFMVLIKFISGLLIKFCH